MEHSISTEVNSAENAVAFPPVDIVVVAHNPDEWFGDVLNSFAIQDYPDFNVVVLTTGEESQMRHFVHEYLPQAQVQAVESDHGYGRNLNSVLDLETDSAFFLFCHHDVALAPDALRLMVEESLRSNAGIVGPKIVNWDRPDELLDIGYSVDKLGFLVSRVEPGELDQEQHDSVSDVFMVSSTVVLVRADLFQALSGFDEEIGMVGEDLDLCWKAHLAGARVLIVPLALARHREERGKYRTDGEEEKHRERHRLRVVLSSYGFLYSLFILPQAFLLSLIRTLGSLLIGDLARVRLLAGSWAWNLLRPRSLFARRKRIKAVRRLPDRDLRSLQSQGFALVKSFFKDQPNEHKRASGMVQDRFKRFVEAMREGPSKVSAIFIGLTTLVFFFGSRHLITRKVPVVGELVPFDLGIEECFSLWFSNWWASGIGNESTNPTALGITGLLGVFSFGSMGLLRLILTLGMLPFGVAGVWCFLKPFNSPWIRVAGASIYFASPVPYSALRAGSWSALILYGTLPWLLVYLSQAGRLSPFGTVGGPRGRNVLPSNWLREALGLGILIGFMIAFVPFAGIEILAIVTAIFIGSLLSGWPSGTFRLISVLSLGAMIAIVINLPWLIDSVIFDPSWKWFVGTRPTASISGDLSDFLRLESQSSGKSIFGWGFLSMAIVPLLLAKGERWAWAIRSWVMYLGGVSVLWVNKNDLLDIPLPRPEVLLAPASLGLAIAGAMGVGALQRDLQTFRFGWRQLVPVSALVAFALVVLPVFGNSFSGNWGMPNDELNQVLGLQESEIDYNGRVLWVGHDDLLAASGQSFEDGLTLSVTAGLESSFIDRWDSGKSVEEPLLQEVMDLAVNGGTAKLGRLLAPFGISDIVLVGRSSPLPSKGQIEKIPVSVESALGRQLDLIRIEASPGIVRYRNVSAIPVAAILPDGQTIGRTLRSFASDPLPDNGIEVPSYGSPIKSFEGFVEGSSEIFLATPSGSSWQLSVDGEEVEQKVALEWGMGFDPNMSGDFKLSHQPPWSHKATISLQAVLWVLILLGYLRASVGAGRSSL